MSQNDVTKQDEKHCDMDRKEQSRVLMKRRRNRLKEEGWKTLTVHVRPGDVVILRKLLATLEQPT